MRTLAHHCSSTALALSLHTHLVATAVWRWRNQKVPAELLLKRVAAEAAMAGRFALGLPLD